MRSTFEYEIDSEQYLAALKFNQRRLMQQPPIRKAVIAFGFLSAPLWGVIGFLAISLVSESWICLIALGSGMMLIGLNQLLIQRAIYRYLAGPEGRRPGRCTVRCEDSGLRVATADSESLVSWSGIRGVEEPDMLVLLYYDSVRFFLIPDSAFSGAEERAQFLAEIRQRVGGPGAQAAPVSADPPPSSGSIGEVPSIRSDWAGLLSNLKLGVRLAFFQRPRAEGLRVSWSQFVMLAVLGIAVPLLSDLARIGLNGSFSAYALPGAVFHLPVMILAAWAIACVAGRAQSTLDFLIAIAAMAIPIDVTYALVHAVTSGELTGLQRGWQVYAYYAPTLWLFLAASVAAVRIFGIARGRWATTALAAGLALAYPLIEVDHERSLWLEPYDEAAAAEYQNKHMAITGEDAFYLQPRLLERELAALKPGQKGVIDLYFVGAAGYSGQDVFMKEVHSVSSLFRERFGTEGRSVTLINNAKTVAASPIASATSLGLALRRVGEVMNRDEDVLFLFLTSHGSKDHKFSLDFWPLRFNTLDPKRLRELLDASGIKRRVIVVSACYSGGFIDALKDEHSLVIAAAAPDKNSFGCSNESDFTYFGKAYFDEALRRTYSFSEAFAIAKPIIADREKKEGFAGSDPRIHIGNAIRQPLEEFIHLREAAPPPPTLHPHRAD